MHSWRVILISLAVVGLCALAGSATALAAGPGSSAGDQQYVDPLSGTTGSPATNRPSQPASPPSSASGSTGSSGSSSAPSSSGASSGADPSSSAASASSDPATATATATTASTTPTVTSAPTLPRTGFDLWLAAGLGLALMSGGLYLRRALVRGPSQQG